MPLKKNSILWQTIVQFVCIQCSQRQRNVHAGTSFISIIIIFSLFPFLTNSSRRNCLQQWIRVKRTCPVCRNIFVQSRPSGSPSNSSSFFQRMIHALLGNRTGNIGGQPMSHQSSILHLQELFPDIPLQIIQQEYSRSRNVEVTANRLLRIIESRDHRLQHERSHGVPQPHHHPANPGHIHFHRVFPVQHPAHAHLSQHNFNINFNRFAFRPSGQMPHMASEIRRRQPSSSDSN